jgi:CheY-like chemotaxis protein
MLAVSDTGSGMEAAEVARLQTISSLRSAAAQGIELGLPAVFAIVAQQGGRLAVESEPGAGTTYRIYLPRLPETAAPDPDLPGEAEPHAVPATILLVEDDTRVRGLLRAVLELEGHLVLEARDADDALVISRRRTGPIDLLITDVGVPRLRGPQLADRLAASRPELKLLFISGYHDEAIRSPGSDAPAAFIHKPFTPTAFAQKVREALVSGE